MTTVLADARAIVYSFTNLDETDVAISLVVDQVLEASKSLNGGVYRPFIAAAAIGSSYLLRAGIIEADGVKWEPTSEVIEGLLALQEAFDSSGGLVAPPGWSVSEYRDSLMDDKPCFLSAMIAI